MAKEDSVWSGVTVLDAWFCMAGRRAFIAWEGAGAGVCQENVGVVFMEGLAYCDVAFVLLAC